jgi:chromosome segregation ATPase
MDNSETKISKVIESLLGTCRTLYNSGKDVNHTTLKFYNPNHSNRDYVKALEIFNDEIASMEECPVKIPESSLNIFNNLVQRLWSELYHQSEIRIAKVKEDCERKLSELRDARDKAYDELDTKNEENKLKDEQIKTLTEEISGIKAMEHEYQEEIQRLTNELTIANVKIETLNESVQRLTDWRAHTDNDSDK